MCAGASPLREKVAHMPILPSAPSCRPRAIPAARECDPCVADCQRGAGVRAPPPSPVLPVTAAKWLFLLSNPGDSWECSESICCNAPWNRVGKVTACLRLREYVASCAPKASRRVPSQRLGRPPDGSFAQRDLSIIERSIANGSWTRSVLDAPLDSTGCLACSRVLSQVPR